ncbi:hypothetical protein GMORB2_1355 [Geosmithia morbida]|uniref:Uncharacterized protein n=1 Tax=Geosmithia morbida TaxID=1094350 RepID=A0A9P5D937_9HYPO|nr:uncharacterized protein GMORB2_1355 [Geosmithia morbida]KAF4126109.1 hypothetical protein GMORB2_1355 [Geosmithia morbida]
MPSFISLTESVWAFPQAKLALHKLHSTRSREAVTFVFRPAEAGGIDFSKALGALAFLDGVEIHRLRALSAIRYPLEAATVSLEQAQIIEGLHETASKRYERFHLGFRGCILMDGLRGKSDSLDDRLELMALLNALFPATVHLGHLDDVDPSAYSSDLRRSIRFSIYEYIMRQVPFSKNHSPAMRMRLHSWYGVPSYDESREALTRYAEEFKKSEELCFLILRAAGGRQSGRRSATSRIPSLTWSRSSPTWCGTVDGSKPETRRSSTHSSCQATPSSPMATLLLDGVPAQEILGAQTDLGAFVGNPASPCDSRLSGTGYDQHPLTRDLDMTPAQKASLGLLIPRAIQRRGS